MPETTLELKAYDNFLQGINTKATRIEYEGKLRQFQKYTKIESWDAYIKKDPMEIHRDIERFIAYNKTMNVRNHSIKNKLNPILLLLKMNFVPTHDKVLKTKLKRDDVAAAGHEPFTQDEIRSMLEVSKTLRTKALIHFWASTGCRPASITDPILRKKHLFEMPNNCLAIKIYDESKSGYWAFLTPEATKALNRYLKSRQINGEKITDESPIFTNTQDTYGTKGQPITIRSAREIMFRVIKKAGIQRTKIGPRYDKAVIYAFRHRFNKILKINNSVNSNIAEKLMAHKKGLDGTYLNPTREECFTEFVKAIPELMIDPTERQKQELEKNKTRITELEDKTRQITDLEEQMKRLQTQVSSLTLEKKTAEKEQLGWHLRRLNLIDDVDAKNDRGKTFERLEELRREIESIRKSLEKKITE